MPGPPARRSFLALRRGGGVVGQLDALALGRRALLELARLPLALGAVPVGGGHEQERQRRQEGDQSPRAGGRRSSARGAGSVDLGGAGVGRPVRSVWLPSGESRSSPIARAPPATIPSVASSAQPDAQLAAVAAVGHVDQPDQHEHHADQADERDEADRAIGTAGTRCDAVITRG